MVAIWLLLFICGMLAFAFGIALLPVCFLWMTALVRVPREIVVKADDRNCACGYSLDGLAFDARCPECGRDRSIPVTRIRHELSWRKNGFLDILIAMLPLVLSGVSAAEGLSWGYQRMGFEAHLASRYAAEDPSPDVSLGLSGVAMVGALASVTRRMRPWKRSLLLLASVGIWCLALVAAYSLDAHRRGLDITWGIAPVMQGLLWVSTGTICITAAATYWPGDQVPSFPVPETAPE